MTDAEAVVPPSSLFLSVTVVRVSTGKDRQEECEEEVGDVGSRGRWTGFVGVTGLCNGKRKVPSFLKGFRTFGVKGHQYYDKGPYGTRSDETF